jgi:hypothetical protein
MARNDMAFLTAAICSLDSGWTGRRHSPTFRPERFAAFATGLNGNVRGSLFNVCCASKRHILGAARYLHHQLTATVNMPGRNFGYIAFLWFEQKWKLAGAASIPR